MSAPLILAFDTSAAHCAAALLSGTDLLGAFCEPMTKGQAERLVPLLQGLLNQAGKDWSELNLIGVGIGPGNFTGIRIAVSTARGLALSLNIPAIGVSTFDALHHAGLPGLALVRAPRDMVYAAYPDEPADLIPLEEAEALPTPLLFADDPAELAVCIAQVAATRDSASAPRPAPLYMRAADAAPASDAPPVILP